MAKKPPPHVEARLVINRGTEFYWQVKYAPLVETAARKQMTEKKPAAEEFDRKFRQRRAIQRNNGVRTAFIRQEQEQRLLLFINGVCITLESQYLQLAVMITEQTAIHTELERNALSREFSKVLHGLYNKGIYHFRQGTSEQVRGSCGTGM